MYFARIPIEVPLELHIRACSQEVARSTAPSHLADARRSTGVTAVETSSPHLPAPLLGPAFIALVKMAG
jgi:hypothetical protein